MLAVNVHFLEETAQYSPSPVSRSQSCVVSWWMISGWMYFEQTRATAQKNTALEVFELDCRDPSSTS
eukprot:m.311651 g.311651  ORF g.311651 m.311651 type:complete len:67 (-) comp16386_c0_seq4:102-302(-)